MMKSKKVKKKNILITGAGRGIGLAIAKAVEDVAENLILVTKSKESFRYLEKYFPRARNFNVDLSNEEKTTKFIANIKYEFDRLDVLINNAGFYVGKKFEETTTSDFEELYKIHLKAPFLLIQSLLPLLKKSDCPQVINISSAANFVRIPGESAYTAMKAGLSAMGDVLRNELQRYSIRFTTIHPNAVDTRNFENPQDFLAPEDMGDVVLFIVNTHPYCQISNIELSSVSDWRGNWPPWIPK
ncbi:MAG: SDR family NAD(P)-dependent oxidoreductase [Candidatus Methanoperedens sp.]|nr:SDR family NAD(P)-dependent oxidoreductase [Candidatus Methanoperedens sp.]